MTASEDHAVFLRVRLKEAAGRAARDDDVGRWRRLDEPVSGKHRQEDNEQDGSPGGTATPPERFGNQSHNSRRTSLFPHKNQIVLPPRSKTTRFCKITSIAQAKACALAAAAHPFR